MRELITGEFVKTEFEGEGGALQRIYGRVIRSGQKVFYVRWASGAVIRYFRDEDQVALCEDQEGAEIEYVYQEGCQPSFGHC